MSGNIKDDNKNYKGELCPYIFISFRIIIYIKVYLYAINNILLIKEANSITP
jgi:hypothetical protein